jgi:hypothetical protein
MSHTYNRRDCEEAIHAKKLPYRIVKVAGIFRLRTNFSNRLINFGDWDKLYAEISSINTEPSPLVLEGVEVRDPKTMIDADFAVS